MCADVHVTACLSFVVRVTTYLFWIDLLFVCNTTAFVSLSLVSTTGLSSHTLSVSPSVPSSSAFCVSIWLCYAFCANSVQSLELPHSLCTDFLKVCTICKHVCLCVRTRTCTHLIFSVIACVYVCPHLTFLAQLIRFFQATHSALYFLPTSNSLVCSVLWA